MSILIIIIGISVLILVHELGHFLMAKKMGLLVEEFGFGFPPRIFSKKIGETTYSLNLLPFGGFVRIFGEERDAGAQTHANDANAERRSFARQKAWRRAVIIVAGVFMNFILGWLLTSFIFMIGVPKTLIFSHINADSPAAAAGLIPGDQAGDFTTSREFIDFINQNRGQEITLSIQRSEEVFDVKLTPRAQPPAGEGPLGVGLVEAGVDRHSFFSSLFEGMKNSLLTMLAIVTGFIGLLSGLATQGQMADGFVGPIGIFGVANQAGALGFVYLVQLLALISLNLTVLNILPFPALDGGRLFFIIIEKIKGSPLPSNVERSINAAGFMFLLILMLAITVRDIIALL